jgi:hypothetical protein
VKALVSELSKLITTSVVSFEQNRYGSKVFVVVLIVLAVAAGYVLRR